MVSYKLIYWIFVVILTVFQGYRGYVNYSGVEEIGGEMGAFLGAMLVLAPATGFYFAYIFASKNKDKNEKRNKQ